MKVIIVTRTPFPNGMAATQRVKCYARCIMDKGVNCEVVICRRTEYICSSPKNVEGKGVYEGVPYFYVSGTPLRGSNRVVRYLNDIIDKRRTERYLRDKLTKGDVLFLYIGTDVNLMLRFMNVAHKKEAFCVRDLCELPYGTNSETERAIRLRKMTIEKQFPKLDGIISISDTLLNLARTYTLPTCKHLKIPIMVEYEHYVIKEKPEVPAVPYIFHAGTLYQQKDGILGMIEAFGIAKNRLRRPLKYILTGNIKESSHPLELQQLLKKYNIEDAVEFVGYLNRKQIKEYLTYASLVISNRPKSKQDYYGFSTKVGEYLASGTPLLMTNWGESVKWLKNGDTAIITEPEDIEALAEAIENVFAHPEVGRKIGFAGQEVCRNCFDYRNWSKPLIEFLNQLGK